MTRGLGKAVLSWIWEVQETLELTSTLLSFLLFECLKWELSPPKIRQNPPARANFPLFPRKSWKTVCTSCTKEILRVLYISSNFSLWIQLLSKVSSRADGLTKIPSSYFAPIPQRIVLKATRTWSKILFPTLKMQFPQQTLRRDFMSPRNRERLRAQEFGAAGLKGFTERKECRRCHQRAFLRRQLSSPCLFSAKNQRKGRDSFWWKRSRDFFSLGEKRVFWGNNNVLDFFRGFATKIRES